MNEWQVASMLGILSLIAIGLVFFGLRIAKSWKVERCERCHVTGINMCRLEWCKGWTKGYLCTTVLEQEEYVCKLCLLAMYEKYLQSVDYPSVMVKPLSDGHGYSFYALKWWEAIYGTDEVAQLIRQLLPRRSSCKRCGRQAYIRYVDSDIYVDPEEGVPGGLQQPAQEGEILCSSCASKVVIGVLRQEPNQLDYITVPHANVGEGIWTSEG